MLFLFVLLFGSLSYIRSNSWLNCHVSILYFALICIIFRFFCTPPSHSHYPLELHQKKTPLSGDPMKLPLSRCQILEGNETKNTHNQNKPNLSVHCNAPVVTFNIALNLNLMTIILLSSNKLFIHICLPYALLILIFLCLLSTRQRVM
jgi:hypothetical protein